MTVRKVLRMGDTRLSRVASEVTSFDTTELHQLVEDMLDTMQAENGAGLAAPQIGVDARVVVFEVADNPRYPEAESVPRTILINPVITPLDEEMQAGWEGCLSVPGMRGVVPRHRRIRYAGYTVAGDRIERVASDFHARVVQHECDHLDGILYPQRVVDFSLFGFIDELAASGHFEPSPCDDPPE